jgi:hypothetical protein
VIRYKQAAVSDAGILAASMRENDRNEVLAMGMDPEDAIASAIHMSLGDAWLFYFGEKLGGVWGVVPSNLLCGYAVPWLLTTGEVDRNKRAFFTESRRLVTALRKKYTLMSNMIDERYVASLRWAKRLGFTVHEAVEHGPYGARFCQITMEG